MDGDENELKSLSRASFLKTTSRWKGEIGLAYCDTVEEAFLLYRFPVSILVPEHLHNITTYRLATTVQEKPGCILYFLKPVITAMLRHLEKSKYVKFIGVMMTQWLGARP